ncbi:TPA: hypothetical protein DDZ86_02970 [Candidatus Dependentiae bacterium]|nr:MAG: hypothetical protein UW09_C0001G0053 [candidate division TM6 bacterium GW2011_GWF2_43_87]HBL98581.1 hypothetical protein [Candidatus Dependentiae bacterium]
MNRKDLKFLESHQKYPSVSILVKTHRTMPAAEQDPIAVKNAVSEVKERLKKEFSERDVKKLLDNLDSIVGQIDYAHSTDGLAIFVNEDVKLVYSLPYPVENRVSIETTFLVRDILIALNRLTNYWVLALSEKPTRLFYGTGATLSEVIEPENDTMGISRDGFPLDYIKPEVGETANKIGNTVLWNSHQDAAYLDDRKKTFFKKVDELLLRFTSVYKRPLFVVGAEKNIVLFEDVTKHKIAGRVHGDFSHQFVRDLEKVVWPEVQKYLDKVAAQKLVELDEAVGKLHHAFGIEMVWRMAHEGRVKDLIIEDGFLVSGVIDKEHRERLTLATDPKAINVMDDVVNVLIENILEKGGVVTFVKPGTLKEQKRIAAILRY